MQVAKRRKKMWDRTMKLNLLGKTSAPFLKLTLNAYSTRHKAIAKNVSNVETEGYRPVKVSFEENLRKVSERNHPTGIKTHPRHLQIGANSHNFKERITVEDRGVNLEQEMAELAKNQIRFEFVARKLRATYDTVRASITGHF
jgi:flagellar basal-body rod protein FlgB